MALLTKRLLFQKYRAEDLGIYQQLMSNPQVANYITGLPPTFEQSKKRFEYILELNARYEAFGFFKVMERKSNAPIGLAKLVRTDEKQAEIGYAVFPEHWKKGFGSEITNGLIFYTSNNTPLSSLLAIVHPENKASIHLLKSFGFQFSHRVKDQKFESLSEAYVLGI